MYHVMYHSLIVCKVYQNIVDNISLYQVDIGIGSSSEI